ncbi:hypothetical protein [Halalkalicoccus sp. NIPERK01]|uniref:hypothetical protein n=1 Tax=Halalkalicoccus sp. NIPERK01 TaxID=3053469 RepID=UPI00256F2BB5|nr:hypothetical protein [Halalkalicoccus sp. NIPERK01]MDL5362883.1 hypothetical protein [Halalkalicoccus sp. NIPERK01]
MFPVPLFGPVPGGIELTILLLILLILFGVVGRWVYRDARSRGNEWAWQLAVLIAGAFFLGVVPGLLALGVYVLARGERGETA